MIDSPANSTVKLLRSLVTPKGRREHGLFLAEGVRLVEDAVGAGHRPEIVLYNYALLKRTARAASLLKTLQSSTSGAKVYEASERALQASSDTQHSQGIVAAFPTIEWPPVSPQGTPSLALICDDIQDPGNLGTILRSAEAAGVTAVWLTPDCVDPYNPKVVRAAMGAHFRLPFYTGWSWRDIERDLGRICDELQVLAAESSAALPYDMVDWTRPSVLIVSSEAHGLSVQGREYAERVGSLITIPMAGGTESLNAAVAASILLFEAARQRRHPQSSTE
jgi:TrmH family RNA methyltransferase